MARQLAFDLPANVRQEAEDFFVSDANETAYAMVCAPETWPDGKLALVGPRGSGKTHLAQLFATQTGAALINARDIDPSAPLPDTACVIDDCDTLPAAAEEWLFHTHNHLRALRLPLLVTATSPPARWPIKLPDLASRLSAATTIPITDPDDALLTAVLLKLFAQRQLAPTPNAITYLQRHLPRSFQAIRDVVDTLDSEALAQSKSLTRPFVRDVLDRTMPDAQ